jgi:hypothetical protein
LRASAPRHPRSCRFALPTKPEQRILSEVTWAIRGMSRSCPTLGEIGALKVLIATTVGERDEALAALAAGREALASSHASLAETERFIGLLQATLAERDGALAEMSKRAEELAAALETVQAELSKRDDALSHAEAALSNQSAAAEALQAENAVTSKGSRRFASPTACPTATAPFLWVRRRWPSVASRRSEPSSIIGLVGRL